MTPRKSDFPETKKKSLFLRALKIEFSETEKSFQWRPEKEVLSQNEESLSWHPEKAIFWKQINRFLHGALKSDFSENEKIAFSWHPEKAIFRETKNHFFNSAQKKRCFGKRENLFFLAP
jgi:hypothetical protein